MFKGILILLFIGLITFFVIVMVILSILRGVFVKIKRMLGMRDYPDEDEVFGGKFDRTSQQYHFNGGNGSTQNTNGNPGPDFGSQGSRGSQRRKGGADGRIVDTRDSGTQHRKIFSKDEGEYVSYEEVDE